MRDISHRVLLWTVLVIVVAGTFAVATFSPMDERCEVIKRNIEPFEKCVLTSGCELSDDAMMRYVGLDENYYRYCGEAK